MTEILFAIITGIVSGIIASWLFWRFQFENIPEIVISDLIAESTDSMGEIAYRFKIVNNGKHQVTNLHFRAWLCELKDVPEGQVSSSRQELPVQNSPTATLAPAGNNDRPWGLTPETTIRTVPGIDLKTEPTAPHTRILITLKASDAVSGSTVVIQKTYLKQDIVVGNFVMGASLKIERS